MGRFAYWSVLVPLFLSPHYPSIVDLFLQKIDDGAEHSGKADTHPVLFPYFKLHPENLFEFKFVLLFGGRWIWIH